MAIGDFWGQLRAAAERISRQRQTCKRRRHRGPTLLRAELLERRELLSVNTISLDTTKGQLNIAGTTGNEQITVTMDSPTVIRVRAQSVDGLVEATFQRDTVSSLYYYGGDGDDRFENATGISAIALGERGNDLLIGGSGVDNLYGGDGSDHLYGSGGDDLLLGGTGNDYLQGGDGNDTLQGEDGHDMLEGTNGADALWGGAGNDTLVGGAGADFVYGGFGNDRLVGGTDGDWLQGDEGRDQLEGESGNDTLLGGLDNDTLYGGAGNDTLYGEAGNDTLDGMDGDDILQGGADDDVLSGGAGADRLFGNEGADTLRGGDDDDWLQGDAGNDRLEGEVGNDTLLGGAGDDTLLGGLGNDKVHGEDGNDTLDGMDGDDYVQGGAGDDVLSGGAGADRLFGNEGADTLRGGDDDDWLQGDDGNDRLEGEVGNDTLLGGAGDDILLAGLGNDKVHGEDGNDWANGADGDDEMTGGAGNDTLLGGNGDDQIIGMAGNDTMLGNAGDDRLDGSEGNDTEFGGDGDDYLIGNQGNDWLQGDGGDDEIIGVGESDYMFGGAGNDRIWAQTGQHALVGGDGDDVLVGAEGNDLLIGGAGRDYLSAAGGEDLLIGGATAYDANYVQLNLLFAAWVVDSSYATRVAQIASDSFATQLQLNKSVFDDAVADQIYGGDGQDWFFRTGQEAIYDPNAAAGHDHSVPGSSESGGHSHGEVVVLDHLPMLEGFAFVDSLDKISDRDSSETLSTLLPMPDNASLQREHLTLTQLVRYDQVTHFAVNSGAWSNPSTWSDGIVPSNGSRVLIPIGVNVTVDRMLATRINTIRVDGTLSFSTTASTELRVDTIVVTSIGRFEMGTAEAPIPARYIARVVFTDNGPIDRVADPFALGRGLISNGSVSIYGSAVTSRVAINGPAMAGATQLSLKSVPSGWKVGDWIVVASSTAGSQQNETRRISSILGNQVMLNQPLIYDHIPLTAAEEIHVANETRNAQFNSESTVIDRRGHVMFMHSRDAHVANAGFYSLGRTNKEVPINDPVVNANWQLTPGTGTNPRARYSVHFHRTGSANDGDPSTVTGSVVVDSPGWGFVNHSSYVDMVDNVAAAVHGAAFVTEVGDEIGSFVNNIAIGTTGSGDSTESRVNVQDFGHQGDGFWLQGPGVTVTGNISAGNDGSAFFLFARGLSFNGVRAQFPSSNLSDPSLANGAPTVSVESVPMKLFTQNVGYSSNIGLSVWYHNGIPLDSKMGEFTNSTFWNNTHGVDLPYTKQTALRNLTITRTPEGGSFSTRSTGVNANLVTSNILYDNLTISGFWRGIAAPRRGTATVLNGRYDNHIDFLIETAVAPDRAFTVTGDVVMRNLVMDTYIETPAGAGTYAFYLDRVFLNFGSFRNQRVYYLAQAPTAVPFPVASAGIPPEYIGKTSQQIWDQYGVAIGGALAPSNAISIPLITGLLGPEA
ncbi:MAG: G8 domain-containing protein [Pirellulales bacterium]